MGNLMYRNSKVVVLQSHFDRAQCDVIPSGVEESNFSSSSLWFVFLWVENLHLFYDMP
jgi:hypothetical protein